MTEVDIVAAKLTNDPTLNALLAVLVDSADTLRGKTVEEAIEAIANKRR